MGDISPVLASFLAGQQGQTDLIKTAQGIANQRQTAQQRQQEIDDTMKRFDQQHILEQKRVDLELQTAADTHNLHLMNARNQVMDQLRQDPNMAPGTIQIPGIPNALSPNAATATGVGASTMQPPAVGTPVTVNGITVPMPTSNTQLMADQQTALAPIQLRQKQLESDIEEARQKRVNADKYIAENDRLKQTIEEQRDKFMADNATKDRIDQANNATKDALGQLHQQAALSAQMEGLGLPIDAQQRESVLNQMTEAGLNGHLDTTKLVPRVRATVESRIISKGGDPTVPQKTYDSINELVPQVSQFKNYIDALNKSIPVNTNLTSRISSVLGSKGPANLGLTQGQWDAFNARLTPMVELASGYPAGAMRSAAIMKVGQGLIRKPGDSDEAAALKSYMVADLPLSAMQKQISKLPVASRQRIWTNIIRENPDIMRGNSNVHDALVKATQTGNYEAGKPLLDMLNGVK